MVRLSNYDVIVRRIKEPIRGSDTIKIALGVGAFTSFDSDDSANQDALRRPKVGNSAESLTALLLWMAAAGFTRGMQSPLDRGIPLMTTSE